MHKTATTFSEEARKILAFLGILIAEYPGDIKGLLEIHDVDVSTNLGEAELLNKVLYEIELNDPKFRSDLARLIHYRFQTADFDSFSGVPVDPISAIAGAVGSIGDIFSQGQRNKRHQKEARSQAYSSLLAYHSMKRQLAAEQMVQQQSHKTKTVLLQIAGFIVVTGLGIWLMLKR